MGWQEISLIESGGERRDIINNKWLHDVVEECCTNPLREETVAAVTTHPEFPQWTSQAQSMLDTVHLS